MGLVRIFTYVKTIKKSTIHVGINIPFRTMDPMGLGPFLKNLPPKNYRVVKGGGSKGRGFPNIP